MTIERVLITGAAGALGRVLRRHLRGRYALVRLSDIAPMEPAAEGEEVIPADLADAEAMMRLLKGIDAVVHLGGHSVEGTWEQILRANIVGCINLFEAARKAGTERVLFASSNHAVGFHRRWPRTDHTAPPKPDSRYGVSKAFGEILGLFYANKHGLRVFCMRIGSCREQPVDERQLSTWQSYRDFCHLVDVGLSAWYRYEIVYGVSANTRSFWDNSNAERLGYRPIDNAEIWAAQLEGIKSPNLIDELFIGGPFCSPDFSGRIEDIV